MKQKQTYNIDEQQSQSRFFEKTSNIDKPLEDQSRKKKKIQITNIEYEKEIPLKPYRFKKSPRKIL